MGIGYLLGILEYKEGTVVEQISMYTLGMVMVLASTFVFLSAIGKTILFFFL